MSEYQESLADRVACWETLTQLRKWHLLKEVERVEQLLLRLEEKLNAETTNEDENSRSA